MSKDVLVVEDDEAIRETVCELLVDEGYRAIAAANGKEALAFLRGAERPCVILLDLMMPVMDGAEFRAEQLKDPNLSTIPVVVITAGGTGAGSALNPDALLQKPMSIESILHMVERFCGRSLLSGNAVSHGATSTV